MATTALAIQFCPLCSVFKLRHPELSSDILSTPAVLIFKSGKACVIGCHHARPVFGPHPSQDVAEKAWRDVLEGLMFEVGEERAGDIEHYLHWEKIKLAKAVKSSAPLTPRERITEDLPPAASHWTEKT